MFMCILSTSCATPPGSASLPWWVLGAAAVVGRPPTVVQAEAEAGWEEGEGGRQLLSGTREEQGQRGH